MANNEGHCDSGMVQWEVEGCTRAVEGLRGSVQACHVIVARGKGAVKGYDG